MAGPAVAPPAGADGQALIEEARRRHRRRRWIAVAVALAVVAGVALAAGLAGGRAGRHPPARRAHPRTLPLAGRVLPGADTTLLAWPGSGPYGGGSEGPGQLGVYVDDLDSGQLALRPSPPVSAGDIPYIVVRAGHWLVYNYNGDAGVAAARDDLTGRPRRLGRAVTFVPSAVPGQVLLAGSAPAGWGRRSACHSRPRRCWQAPSAGSCSCPKAKPSNCGGQGKPRRPSPPLAASARVSGSPWTRGSSATVLAARTWR